MDYEKINDKLISGILSEFGNPQELKILYVSTYIPNYVRTETILNIFKRNKVQATSILVGGSAFRYLKALFGTILRSKEADVVFLAFRGHEILPFLRLLVRKPIIFDAFVSIYDTLCFDRRVFNPGSVIGRFLKWYDKFLCRISGTVLVDTREHCEYFKKEFNAKNVSYLYVECNKELFKPLKQEKEKNKFIVFWYGKGWPLQGVEVILKAAVILKDEPGIIFRLVGPIKEKYRSLIKDLSSANIEFIDYIPYERLPLEINKADLCLGGHFSDMPKAKRVIAGKSFQFIACGKKTILGDVPTNRELFNVSENIYFVKVNSQEALAKAILEIKNNQKGQER